MSGSDHASAVSVVVPARNASRTIEACLQSLLEHVPAAGREIIVVDNGSRDNTLDIVRRFPVRLELSSSPFVSASRNAGARLATHPLVAFIDSDCTISPGWLDGVQRVLADRTVAVAGCRHVLPDDPTWVEAAWDRAHRRPPASDVEDVVYVPAGNFAVRRDRFLEVGGFDETLETGEDPDLCARLAQRGYRVVQTPWMRCVHLGEPKTLVAVCKRERWHGRGTRLRYGDGRLAPIMISTIAFSVLLAIGVLGSVLALTTGRPWFAVSSVMPLVCPAGYAAMYAKPPRLKHAAQLFFIYTAYFLGRAAALPVVVSRAWERARRSSVASGGSQMPGNRTS